MKYNNYYFVSWAKNPNGHSPRHAYTVFILDAKSALNNMFKALVKHYHITCNICVIEPKNLEISRSIAIFSTCFAYFCVNLSIVPCILSIISCNLSILLDFAAFSSFKKSSSFCFVSIVTFSCPIS